MTTKTSTYDVRRRTHGEVIESAVLDELAKDGVITIIKQWDSLIRPLGGQPFFMPEGKNAQYPLDEVAYVTDEQYKKKLACIIEVKAMRSLDWHEWRDHSTMHIDKFIQHQKHVDLAKQHGLDGVCIVAVNKDSSEYLIRCYDENNTIQGAGWEYEY